ncbi:hypothetical protein N9250_01145 [bacterium]|nr:hypothetical protein [bacterium]
MGHVICVLQRYKLLLRLCFADLTSGNLFPKHYWGMIEYIFETNFGCPLFLVEPRVWQLRRLAASSSPSPLVHLFSASQAARSKIDSRARHWAAKSTHGHQSSPLLGFLLQ